MIYIIVTSVYGIFLTNGENSFLLNIINLEPLAMLIVRCAGWFVGVSNCEEEDKLQVSPSTSYYFICFIIWIYHTSFNL
jgi:hypothetical protein